MTSDLEDAPAGRTTLMPYWDRVAGQYAADDPLGAVCYPAAPAWFNRFYAFFHRRAVERMLGDLPLAGTRCLDVGCGSGRWCRWLAARGAQVTGIDPTAAMLDAARRLSPSVEFHRMSATNIDLPAGSFDLITTVTVIQHLQPAEQERAVASMGRAIRPGGMLFALDLIDVRDPGRVVYPRSPASWIALYERQGMDLVRWEGQEYVPLIRALEKLLRPKKRATETDVTAPSVLEKVGRRRAMFLPLGPVMLLSVPLELLCERMLPSTWARHGSFLFRKTGGDGTTSTSPAPGRDA